jgi:hypothetical protein
MPVTPWTKGTSSLPSDRIRPRSGADTKAKGKGRHEEPTKSTEVRKLESLLVALQESVGNRRAEKDPKGGCFCLGIIVSIRFDSQS